MANERISCEDTSMKQNVEVFFMKVQKHEQQAIVAECRASGKMAKQWCEEKGINYRRYLTWATKQNKESHFEPHQQWAEVSFANENQAEEIKLHCGKWTICVEPGFNPTLLADVLKVVNNVC